jgi:hypothetical protein
MGAVIMVKPKYIAIMSGLTSDKDVEAKEHYFNNGSDNNPRQAYFLAYPAYNLWLSFCP